MQRWGRAGNSEDFFLAAKTLEDLREQVCAACWLHMVKRNSPFMDRKPDAF